MNHDIKYYNTIAKHRLHKYDCGSSFIQVIKISSKIDNLKFHFKNHSTDDHSKRGLLHLVSKRKRILNYIKIKSHNKYKDLISSLNLRK